MGIGKIIDDVGNHVIEAYDDSPDRTEELVEQERRLSPKLESWADVHSSDYKHHGRLPHRPDIFSDQRLDRPYRKLNGMGRLIAAVDRSDNSVAKKAKPAVYLPRLGYLEGLKRIHHKAVGSAALSRTMVLGFNETPAFGQEYSSPSLTEYVVECLESDDDKTVGLTSAHLGSLADIAEFSTALNIAIAEEHGFKHVNKMRTLMNKNMAWQSYKLGILPVPISWLLRTGTEVFYGVPPGSSAERHGISDDLIQAASFKFLRNFIQLNNKENMVLAYVPSGSGPERTVDEQTGEPKITLKDPSFTASIAEKCRGGIIAVNRLGETIVMSSIIPNQKPAGVKKAVYEMTLTDTVMAEHVMQAEELTKSKVEYQKLHKIQPLAAPS